MDILSLLPVSLKERGLFLVLDVGRRYVIVRGRYFGYIPSVAVVECFTFMARVNLRRVFSDGYSGFQLGVVRIYPKKKHTPPFANI